ncbi:hypothetical protein E2I00_017926 [Balaenoptera physalus]|uniref:Uncharacterized protein n=1 Tax=Balaenoptera physalus TaxID=9770 RepID=A0A643BT31_BALPH|nr:hypothetical protein E2I00_017926 [Balaenoptera physalus]
MPQKQTNKTKQKNKKENHVHLRTLNGFLYKALTDLLCTSEIYDPNMELSKNSQYMEYIGENFFRSKENAAVVQLLILDLLIKKMTLYRMISGNLRLDSPLWSDSMESALLSNLCRINQEALNSHIMEYKKEEREKT